MKLIKTAEGKTKLKINKEEWERIGREAGWEQDVGGAFGGLAAGIPAGGTDKAREYAERILKGEQREQVLQNQPPTMIQKVDAFIAQMSQGAQPVQQGQTQLSQSDIENKLLEMGEAVLAEMVGRAASTNDTTLMYHLSLAANGDQNTLKLLKQKYTQAQPVARSKKKMTKEAWPEKVKKGRFTEWCKRNGFDGPCIECAKKAANSDDASVRGMSTFYMNTVKPKGKDASDV